MNLPLVSICIPTFNGEPFISATIESALAQSYPVLEIIVSDDNSTDKTLEIIESSCKNSQTNPAQIKILKHERLGIVNNWNYCISQAKGKYIKFLLQDDLIAPDCIAQMVQVAEEDEQIGLVFSPRHLLLSHGAAENPDCLWVYEGCKDIHLGWSTLDRVQSGSELLHDPKLFSVPLNKIGEPTAVLVRAIAFEEIGLFDPNLSQLIDLDMWLRLMSRYKIGFIEEPLSTFRIHPKQQTLENIHSKKLVLDNYRLYTKVLYHLSYRHLEPTLRERVATHLLSNIDSLLQDIETFSTELTLARNEVRRVENEIELAQQYSQALQENLQSMEATLAQTYAELQRSGEELQRSGEELAQRCQELTETYQRLADKDSALVAAYNEIEAMKSSKFWKLRERWFCLKRYLGWGRGA